MTQRFAHTRCNSTAQLLNGLFSSRARHTGQATSEQEALPAKRSCYSMLFLCHIETKLAQLFDERTMLRHLEPAIDALPNLRTNTRDGDNLFFTGHHQPVDSAKGPGQQLGRFLANITNVKTEEQTPEWTLFACRNCIEHISGAFLFDAF